jgi:hypothetical protein
VSEAQLEACAQQHASIKLAGLRRHMVAKYIGQRINLEGAARESVRKELSVLRVALTEAVDQGWMHEAAALACIRKFSASSTAHAMAAARRASRAARRDPDGPDDTGRESAPPALGRGRRTRARS